MGVIVSRLHRLIAAERENRMLRAELEDAKATTEYIAMMTDVDISEPEEEFELWEEGDMDG